MSAAGSRSLDASPLVDTGVLDALAEDLGDREVVEEVVRVYLALLPGRQDTITAAAGRGDLTRLRREAHTLASASATVGALALRDVCRAMEDLPPGTGRARARDLSRAGASVGAGTHAALELWLPPAGARAAGGQPVRGSTDSDATSEAG